MKIGVISDTHIPFTASKLPRKVREYFRKCDLIVHAGDIVDSSVIKELEDLAETKAVAGNMDNEYLKKHLPKKLLFEIEGKKIGVMHGSGACSKVRDLVAKEFVPKPDIIIFGHSHIPVNREDKGTLFFNPGSATDKVHSNKCTFGIIEIENGDIKAEIIDC